MILRTTLPAMLACTASGLSFDEWSRRPVYAVHCKTFKVAQELCGIHLPAGAGIGLSMDRPDDGLSTFRALRPFRSAAAIELRRAVARHIRNQRRQQLPSH